MWIRRLLAYLLVGSCVAVVVLVVGLYMLYGMAVQENPWREADIRTWQAAYDALAELPDFAHVSAQADGSFLLHRYNELAQAAALPPSIADMLHEKDLLGLRKSGDDVFFITSGAADDEWGYVISGDSVVNMDGLWSLDRIAGNVYSFSTMK